MKVIDKIAKAEKEGRYFYSFEYFPPKTPQVKPGRPPGSSDDSLWKKRLLYLTPFIFLLGRTKPL